MIWVIVLSWTIGYLAIGAFTFRRIIVWQIDKEETERDMKSRREDIMYLDGGWILAGAFFWPFFWLFMAFYKLVVVPVWERPTPGEKAHAQERERKRNEHREA
jgi:hypothetical protein